MELGAAELSPDEARLTQLRTAIFTSAGVLDLVSNLSWLARGGSLPVRLCYDTLELFMRSGAEAAVEWLKDFNTSVTSFTQPPIKNSVLLVHRLQPLVPLRQLQQVIPLPVAPVMPLRLLHPPQLLELGSEEEVLQSPSLAITAARTVRNDLIRFLLDLEQRGSNDDDATCISDFKQYLCKCQHTMELSTSLILLAGLLTFNPVWCLQVLRIGAFADCPKNIAFCILAKDDLLQVLQLVCPFLRVEERFQVSQTCRRMHELLLSPVWEEKALEETLDISAFNIALNFVDLLARPPLRPVTWEELVEPQSAISKRLEALATHITSWHALGAFFVRQGPLRNELSELDRWNLRVAFLLAETSWSLRIEHWVCPLTLLHTMLNDLSDQRLSQAEDMAVTERDLTPHLWGWFRWVLHEMPAWLQGAARLRSLVQDPLLRRRAVSVSDQECRPLHFYFSAWQVAAQEKLYGVVRPCWLLSFLPSCLQHPDFALKKSASVGEAPTSADSEPETLSGDAIVVELRESLLKSVVQAGFEPHTCLKPFRTPPVLKFLVACDDEGKDICIYGGQHSSLIIFGSVKSALLPVATDAAGNESDGQEEESFSGGSDFEDGIYRRRLGRLRIGGPFALH